MLSERRLSYLTDMLIQHMISGRSAKALAIAQYLRDYYGMALVPNLNTTTGHRRYRP